MVLAPRHLTSEPRDGQLRLYPSPMPTPEVGAVNSP